MELLASGSVFPGEREFPGETENGQGKEKGGLGNEILLFGFLEELAEILGERVRNYFYFSAPLLGYKI